MTDPGVPTPPWIVDRQLDAVMEGIASAPSEHYKDTPKRVWRTARVVSYDVGAARASVIIDGDSEPKVLPVLGEPLGQDGRCVVVFVPPHGGYVQAYGRQRWTPYAVVLDFDQTPPINIGNGVLRGEYRWSGDLVEFRVRLLWGSTTSGGSGNMRFTLPTDAADTNNVGQPCGGAMVLDLSLGRGWFPAIIHPQDTSRVRLLRTVASIPLVYVDSATPVPWTTGDGVYVRGNYEPT